MSTNNELVAGAAAAPKVLDTKEELILNVKELMKTDNEIAKLKAEIKDRNNKKKVLTATLVAVMKKNEIDCFDINGGSLVFKQMKTKKAITGKTLLAALEQYYANLNEPNLAKDVVKHVLGAREEKMKETIKILLDK